MSKCSLERSSTLRACIEKPSDDFIVEYKSQRRSSKKTIHYELTNRSRPYTAPPKALPAATLRPLERKTRIKADICRRMTWQCVPKTKDRHIGHLIQKHVVAAYQKKSFSGLLEHL
ncbi:hypothetical protein SNK04_011510 [Fusarium graminearum]